MGPGFLCFLTFSLGGLAKPTLFSGLLCTCSCIALHCFLFYPLNLCLNTLPVPSPEHPNRMQPHHLLSLCPITLLYFLQILLPLDVFVSQLSHSTGCKLQNSNDFVYPVYPLIQSTSLYGISRMVISVTIFTYCNYL